MKSKLYFEQNTLRLNKISLETFFEKVIIFREECVGNKGTLVKNKFTIVDKKNKFGKSGLKYKLEKVGKK